MAAPDSMAPSSAFTAARLYGSPTPAQPLTGQAGMVSSGAATSDPEHASRLAHFALTKAPAGGASGNPVFALVIIIGLAVLLVQLSVRGALEVDLKA